MISLGKQQKNDFSHRIYKSKHLIQILFHPKIQNAKQKILGEHPRGFVGKMESFTNRKKCSKLKDWLTKKLLEKMKD